MEELRRLRPRFKLTNDELAFVFPTLIDLVDAGDKSEAFVLQVSVTPAMWRIFFGPRMRSYRENLFLYLYRL